MRAQFFSRQRKEEEKRQKMQRQFKGRVRRIYGPALHNDWRSKQFTAKRVIAVQSTASCNLNRTTAEPRKAFCVIVSKPLGLHGAEFHNPQTMGNTKQTRLEALR